MKNILLTLTLLIASSASAGDIDWTIAGSVGSLPIAPPGNDPGFSVGPTAPTSFVPPDSEFYSHCGAGYSCNFLKSGAEYKFRDEARQKADAERLDILKRLWR